MEVRGIDMTDKQPDWFDKLPPEAWEEYRELHRRYNDDLVELRQQLHNDIQALYLQHFPEEDRDETT